MEHETTKTISKASDLLDTTMLTLEGDLTRLIPQNGKGIIDEWLTTLGQASNTKELATSLEQLKTQVESGQPNLGEVQQLLLTMADQTRTLAPAVGPEGELPTRLEALSAALRSASGQLVSA